MLPRPFRTSTNTSKNIPLPKSKRTKIDVINEDNKENIYLKNLKLTTSSRQFGKELNLIQKRNSFAQKKENNKINMFIKKIPSASQLNSKPNTSSNNRINTSKTKTNRIIVGNNSFGNLRKSANLITSNKHIQSNSFAKKDVKSNTMSISQKKYFNNNLINGVNNTKPFSHIPSASTLITKSNSLSQLNKQKQYSNNIDIVSPQSTKQTYNITNKQQKKQDEQQSQKDKQHSKDKHTSIDSPNINNNNNNSNNLNKTNDQQQLNDKTYHYFQIANNKQLNNPQIPYEYINTIYHNLLIEEKKGVLPKPTHTYFTTIQKEITEQMRSILVDWLIDVHFKFNFTEETLYMTILTIDRFLSVREVTRLNLQLLGIVAMFIACKHEEIDLPKSDDFIYVTDNAYTREEVFKMENEVLQVLKFDFLYPSPIKMFEILSWNFNFSHKEICLGKFLLETFLVDIKWVKYKASIIAGAVCYIVMKFFKMSNYNEAYNKKYFIVEGEKNEKENEQIKGIDALVKECAKDICLFVDNIGKTSYTATQKKFSKSRFEKVACLIMGK